MNTNYHDTRPDKKESFRPLITPLLTALIGAIGVGGWMYLSNGLDGLTTMFAIVAGYWGFQIGKGLQRLPEQQIPKKINRIVENIRHNPQSRIKYFVRLVSTIMGAVIGWYGGNSLILAILGGIAGLLIGEILRFFWNTKSEAKTKPDKEDSSSDSWKEMVPEMLFRLGIIFAAMIMGAVIAGFWGYSRYGWIGAVIAGFLGGVTGLFFGAVMNA